MLNVPQNFLQKISVLFVEDDIETAEEIFDYLSNYFPNIHMAHNGKEGLEKFKLHNPDIVMTDIQMPIMSGLDMLKQIKELSHDTQIIISSSFNEPRYLKQAIDIGVSDYITKPLDLKHLLGAFDKIVQNLYTKYELNQKYIELQELNKELQIQTKKAEEFSKAKSDFLADMSHEIRTPLNAIMGFIDLLKIENRGRKALEYVNIIDSSSKSLLKIIEDILDFSKIESGKLDIDKIDFKTKDELKEITHLFRARCLEKDISLSLIFNDNLPEIINADPLRIKQVISNLLSNAVKFTDKGKNIKVSIDFKEDHLNVSVLDEGKGIASDKLEHIFEKFSQEESSTSRNFGGTGLGLAISRKLVKLMGGNLKIKSEIGKGSEFYFSIPAKAGNTIEEMEDNFNDFNFNGKKILLVEDNKSNRLLMKIILEEMKFDINIASDGFEAIEAFKTNRYDLILMDENMPNMNGIEATKAILELEKENGLRHTPVIALTASALKDDREKFLRAGMDEYLTKPLDAKKLSKMLYVFLK